METAFAPAERVPQEEVRRQYEELAKIPFLQDLLNAIPNMSVVLNLQRQIVFFNRTFAEFLGSKNVDDVLGARPGEAVGCVHARLAGGGCGTTVHCQVCGIGRAVLNSLQLNQLDIQECRMIYGEEDQPLDLRVWSHPLDVNGNPFTLFSLMDISDEKRRKALERVFFHDVLNTAGGVKGLADFLAQPGLSDEEAREMAAMLSEAAGQLIEEICAQRTLTSAEHGDLKVNSQDIDSRDMLNRILHQFHSADVAEGKVLKMDPSAEDFCFRSDPVLLRRVLTNLVKNALEAVDEGGAVTLGSYAKGDSVCFTVHNLTVMPDKVQRQIFTRSFSTKESGRGLGTYSIKLFTEKYLRGKVSFVSDAKEGTRFTVCYPRTIQTS
jgi:signal transduction histidine kinase